MTLEQGYRVDGRLTLICFEEIDFSITGKCHWIKKSESNGSDLFLTLFFHTSKEMTTY